MSKYLYLYRTSIEAAAYQASPEDIQQMLAKWTAWKARFQKEIVDMGDALKPPGKVLRDGVVIDGPFIEAKEVMGGYSIVEAESFEHALEISRSCPMTLRPGGSIEIRELAGY